MNSPTARTGTVLVTGAAGFVGRDLPHRVVKRRPGDVAELVADPTRAGDLLEWSARRNVADMCRDAWEFQRLNPGGYEGRG